jgi:steroid delta-isomerase-like uncharacterized protein
MADPETASTQWFQRVWNERDDAAIEELLAPDGVVHGLGHPSIEVRGPAAFRQYRDGILSAFPDVQIEVVQSVNTEDAEAVLFHVSGTHQGEFMGVPATGRRIAFHGMGMSRLADGKLLESWNVIDFHACLQQLTEPVA